MYKINLINSKKKEVIILDTITSQYVTSCIPKNIDYYEIGVRNEINIALNINFFLLFCYYFFKTKKIMISSILSLCNLKRTKIIISNLDNAEFITKLNQYNTSLNVIMIQNGLKNQNDLHGWSKIKRFPILYGFGEYEEKLLGSMKKPVDEYISAGSLKLGIYKKIFSKKIKNKLNNITYISQYKYSLENKKDNQIWLDHKIKILQYLESIDKNFKILLRNQMDTFDEKKEINFYSKLKFLNKKKNFLKKEKNDYDSYNHCENSKILVSYFSTLAVEFYGIGAKVLFLGGIPDVKEVSENYVGFLPNLPEFTKITTNNVEEIKSKIKFLQNMSHSEYLDLTASSRNFVMHYKKDFMHELIKKKITNILYN